MGGLGQFAGLRGSLAKQSERGAFEGGWGGGVWYPNTHYEVGNNFNCDFNLLIPMSSLLISNKKKYYLAIDWLLTITANFVRR